MMVNASTSGHRTGTAGADSIVGGSGSDFLEGFDGNDTLVGNGGADTLFGGYGRDVLTGGAGDDFLLGGADKDSYDGGSGFDTITFSDIDAQHGAIVNLGEGVVKDDGFGNAETITNVEGFAGGTLFADRFAGDGGDNSFFLDKGDIGYGKGGDDVFLINGAASVDGGSGHDFITGFTLETYRLDGDGGFTTTAATHGVSVDMDAGRILDDGFGNTATIKSVEDLRGSALADHIVGSDATNVLLGDAGNDTIAGGAGNDTLWGEVGNDALQGGSGKDWLIGEGGDDTLDGGSNSDNIVGGAGKDVLSGGTGSDRFLFDDGDTGTTSAKADTITDFKSGDKIDLFDVHIANKSDAFTFIGTDAFSGHKGELRYEFTGGNTVIRGDIDGDGGSDLVIKLIGHHDLVAADFFLG